MDTFHLVLAYFGYVVGVLGFVWTFFMRTPLPEYQAGDAVRMIIPFCISTTVILLAAILHRQLL